jgi:predicted RNase H-like HicB family nuclease
MYPAGWLGWKTLARMGVPILVTFAIARDIETNLYIGKSNNIKGAFAEGETLDELVKNLKLALDDILELELHDGRVSVTARYEESNQDIAFA